MSIPKEMQAWFSKLGRREPILRTVPVPRPGPSDVLIKVQAMGVCHSDCYLLAQETRGWGMKDDFILGHEPAGEIVQLGSKVDPQTLALGDKVVVYTIPGCEAIDCQNCRRGITWQCGKDGSGNYGLGIDAGGFAEYMVVQARAAIKLPPGVDVVAGSISTDAVLTSYAAVKYTANVQPGQTIALFGLGGVGFNALRAAMHLGVKRVLVVDTKQEVLDAAIEAGVAKNDAFLASDANAPKIDEVVAKEGIAVDTCIDFVSNEHTIGAAQRMLRPGGTLVVVGLLGQSATLIVPALVVSLLTIKGSFNGTIEAHREVLELMAQGVIKPGTKTGSINDLPQVLKDLDDGKIKDRMVLLPDWKK